MIFRSRIIVALALFLASTIAYAAPGNCKSLRHITIPASAIGLPTTGATITSASRHHQGGVAYCKVMGRIHPIDRRADDIRFELNLPANWNGKALQYGGGTFDGYLSASGGLHRTAVGLSSQPPPLARGYATFGSDSGHHRDYFPFPDAVNALNAKFARNPEMQRNFAGDALKKTHDAAVILITHYYERTPHRMYFIGGSTGGREALRVAQRFPNDYDGVIAAYAAWDQVELDLQFLRTAQALYAHGGFLGHTQTRLIQHAVLNACDAQDGLRDDIVSDPAACHFDPAALRCKDGHHHGCLSDAQLHTLETYATPMVTATPLSNGVDSIPGYNVLAGADLTGATGFLHFPLRNPVFLFNSFGYVIGDDVLRNFLTVGHHYNGLHFDIRTQGQYHDEVLQQAHEIDSTNPNLAAFAAHSGKLILIHGTADNVIPTNSTIDYYNRVRATMGNAATGSFVRLYIIPGLGHGRGIFNAGFDTIGMLDAWADKDIAPKNLIVTDNNSGRTRPLCVYPTYPRYDGEGSPNVATSFTCSQP
jgi:pimeloyl-ACP methyl ester carboxylesterase